MVLLLFGPPGSGKGTQSRRLSAWLAIPALSTGDMLRGEVAARSAIGRRVEAVLASGALASDELVNHIVERRLAEADCAPGCILDGYPRTVEQALFLDRLVARMGWPQAVVVHLEVPHAVLAARISARMQCPRCGRIYNGANQPPRVAGVCDDDRTPLAVRNDDSSAVIAERFKAYRETTEAVLPHYAGDRYLRVDGNRQPEQVFESVRASLQSLGWQPRVPPPARS